MSGGGTDFVRSHGNESILFLFCIEVLYDTVSEKVCEGPLTICHHA